MDRAEISRIAHTDHPIAAPVSVSSARRLLARLDLSQSGRVADLGCGAGAWLLELLEARPDVSAVGVDTALHPDREQRARERGVADRVTWEETDAATWAPADGSALDAILCIGASHALGGLDRALDALREQVRPGGCVLFGDMIWERHPSPAAQAALDAGPEDLPSLGRLVSTLEQHGFELGYAHVSSPQEWDEYEWSWTGSLITWALREAPTEADREQALEAARAHRRAWLEGYRGELGFVTAVLHDTRTS